MIRLTSFEHDAIAESFYLRDCGREHMPCWRCGADLHAGMLIHVGPQGYSHTRCLVPGRAVHQLHALIVNGRD